MANPKRKRSRNRKSYFKRAKANSHRRRRASASPKRRYFKKSRRRSNPAVRAHSGRKHYFKRSRRRNPSTFGFLGDLKGTLVDVLYLTGGGIVTRSLPQIALSSMNSGIIGYVLNLVTAGLTGAIIGKWRGERAGKVWFLGGVAYTGARVISDYSGYNLLTFAQVNPHSPYLSGDAEYGRGLHGIYIPSNFVLPTNTLANPPAAGAGAVAPAPTTAVVKSGGAGMGWGGSTGGSTNWGSAPAKVSRWGGM